MEIKRNYKRRGTRDFPVAYYIMNRDTDYSVSLNWHPEAEILLMYEGTGVLQAGNNTISLERGCIYFLHPNEVHAMRTMGKVFTRTLVFSKDAIALSPDHFFQKEFVEPLWDGRLQLPRVLTPEHPAYQTVYDQMDSLKTCYMYAPNYKALRLSILIHICTAMLPYCTLDEAAVSIPDTTNYTVKKCLLYLHNHYNRKVTLERMAKELNLNPNYLCTVFRKYTGQSIFTHLTHIRIEHGARLLQTTDLPVSEIATLAGFRSDCLFYRKFKGLMGVTPLNSRKQTIQTEE